MTLTTETGNPTSSNGGATTADPVARIEAWLNQGDDSTGQDADTAQADGSDKPADSAGPTDNPDADAPAKDHEPQITTAQLASFLGMDESEIDVDQDGKPVFKTKINGKEGTAKFEDFRKTYQLSGHAENQVREAAEAKKAADARLQEANQAIQAKFQQIDQSLQQVHQLAAVAQEELKGEYQAVNWDALWQQDPAQARALERRFEQRQARIQGVFQTLGQRQQQAAQAAQWEKQQADKAKAESDQAALAHESQRMTELIPAWKDPAVAAKEMPELRAWALKAGYTADELNALTKAHHVATLHRSWQHDTLQKSRPDVENKVRAAPKLIKPGTAPANDGPAANLKSLKQQVKNASGGNSTKALAAWLEAAGKA